MLICTPIREKTQKTVLKKLNGLKGKVDLAEIWLDHIQDLDLKSLLKGAPMPVVCVCKNASEKGLFKGADEERLKLLSEALRYGAAYIDIPYLSPKVGETQRGISPPPKIGGARGGMNLPLTKGESSGVTPEGGGPGSGCGIILSHHDFQKTPSLNELLKLAREMKNAGADVIKIATRARSLDDGLKMAALAQILQSEKIPHILIAMGKKGMISRVLTPLLGGAMMFAPLSPKTATAEGQLTVRQLRSAWSLIDSPLS